MATGGGSHDRWQAPFDWNDFPFEDVKILIFGKSKQGKTSLGNLILGETLLDVNREPGQDAEPWFCACRDVDGKQIAVVDIPGHIPKAVEVMFSREPLFPGPHALMFVIDGTASFTKYDKDYLDRFLRNFERDVIKHIVLVVTHFDQIENNEKTYIEETVNNNRYLQDVFRRCDQRYALIDNSPQRTSEDGQRIKQQQHRVLNVVSNLVKTQETVFISNRILDKIIVNNVRGIRNLQLAQYLLNADKQLLLKISQKYGRTLSGQICGRLQNFPTENMQENYRVWREVTDMVDQRRDALDTEMDRLAIIFTRHTELLRKYDMNVENVAALPREQLQAIAVIVGGVAVAVAFLLSKAFKQ